MTSAHDRHAHFLVMLGDVCAAARLAGQPIEVTLDDGSRHTGVPEARESNDPADTYDDTGLERRLRIDGTIVPLGDVVAFQVAFAG